MESRKNKFFFILLFLSLCSTSCYDIHCNWLIAKLEKEECHNEDGCIIDLKDIFEEEWNSLYFFETRHDSEEISKGLGFEYLRKGIPDGITLIISTAEKKILEEYRIECFPIQFRVIDYDAGFIKIESDSSKLKLFIKEDELVGGSTYILEYLNGIRFD